MTYQTPELLAKQVIDRLAASQVDGAAVWIHTAHLSPENRHPRKMNMLAHLLMPLTQSGSCRPFFLTNNDILLIGMIDLQTKILPIIEQMRGVLSDDAFVTQNPASFFTVFNLKTGRELLLSGLDTLSCTPPVQTQSDLYPQVQSIFKKKDLTLFVHRRPVLHLTPKLKKHTLTLCTPDVAGLLNTTITDTALLPAWMKDSFEADVLTHLLEMAGFLNEVQTPILLPINASNITTQAFDFFISHRTKPTYFLFDLSQSLNEKTLASAQKKCHSLRYKWGFMLQDAAQLSLIDFTKTGPDFIVMPALHLTPDILPAGLKKETVLLTHVDTDTTLFNALRAGFCLFEGTLPATLIGAGCQSACPYGDTCPSDLCAHIRTGKTPLSACVFPQFHHEYLFSLRAED